MGRVHPWIDDWDSRPVLLGSSAAGMTFWRLAGSRAANLDFASRCPTKGFLRTHSPNPIAKDPNPLSGSKFGVAYLWENCTFKSPDVSGLRQEYFLDDCILQGKPTGPLKSSNLQISRSSGFKYSVQPTPTLSPRTLSPKPHALSPAL